MNNETNGTTGTETKKSGGMPRLEAVVKEHEALKAANKLATKKEQLEQLAAFKKARAAVEAAEAALLAAQEAQSKVSEDIVRRSLGKRNLDIDGVTWVPMSKGEKVYFRRLGSADVFTLGT